LITARAGGQFQREPEWPSGSGFLAGRLTFETSGTSGSQTLFGIGRLADRVMRLASPDDWIWTDKTGSTIAREGLG
jgi:hypothetical protein